MVTLGCTHRIAIGNHATQYAFFSLGGNKTIQFSLVKQNILDRTFFFDHERPQKCQERLKASRPSFRSQPFFRTFFVFPAAHLSRITRIPSCIQFQSHQHSTRQIWSVHGIAHGTKAAKSGHLVPKYQEWSQTVSEGLFGHESDQSARKEPSKHPESSQDDFPLWMFENTLKIHFPIVFSIRRALRDKIEISSLQGGSIPSGTYLRHLGKRPTAVLEAKSRLDSTFRTLCIHYFEFHATNSQHR